MLLPNNLASRCIEAKKVPLGAKAVNLPHVYGWRCARAVAVFHIPVIAGIGVRPKKLTGGFAETENTLRFWFQLMVDDKDATLRHHRTRVSIAHLGSPTNFQSGGG